MPTAVRRAAWAEWAGWTCKEPRGFEQSDVQNVEKIETPVGKPAGVFCCTCHRVSIYLHLERSSDSPSNASRACREMRGTLHPHRRSAIYSPEGKLKCLRRILPCAWSTRQRICFLTRRVSRAESSRETSVRCRAARAFHSRTGSSSFAIKDSGTSVFVDRQPTSSAIDRIRDDGRQRRAPLCPFALSDHLVHAAVHAAPHRR